MLAILLPSGFWALLAFLCFITFCLTLFYLHPASFILLSPLLFLRATELLSGVVIEYGAYIEELTLQGYATGAFTRLSALYIVVFAFAALVTERSWSACKAALITLPARLDHTAGFWLFMTAALALVFYVFGLGAIHGFPAIEGIDRFAYRRDLHDPVVNFFFGNRLIIVFVLGFFALQRRLRTAAVLGIIGTFTVSILYSEKFTSLALMAIMSAMPYALLRVAREGTLPLRWLVWSPLAIAALTLPLILNVYGIGHDPALAMQKLADRVAAQGELWWVADRDHLRLFRLEAEPLIADIQSWLRPGLQTTAQAGTQFGLYYVMQSHAPGEVTFIAALQGTGYVFSLFAYLMMTTGLTGVMLVALVTHGLYALVMGWLLRAMADADWLALIVAMKLFIYLVSGGFLFGYLWFFFGIKTLALIGVLWVLRTWRAKDLETNQVSARAG